MARLATTALFCLLGAGCAGAQSTIVPSSLGPLRLTTLRSDLQAPWGMAFLPDGSLLVTERPGNLRRLEGGVLSAPITGVPAVWYQGQGGLLDVAIDPAFHLDPWVYLSYAEAGAGGLAGTAVARGRLVGGALQDVQVIFRQQPKLSSGNHFGSRLVFDRDGLLYVSLGENNVRPTAQYLDHHQGKVVRIRSDGSIPEDNPYLGVAGALPELWSVGHRNPQGATLNPWTGALWTAEHGPMGGDEINRPQPGLNYGWPIITHGLNYNGQPIPESVGDSAPGMEQPLYYWVPSIAPSNLAFYTGLDMHAWHGDLFVGALAGQMLVRLDMDGDAILGEERLLQGLGYRVRDVSNGPDDALYLLTDNGRLLKLQAAKPTWTRETQSRPGPGPAPRRPPATSPPDTRAPDAERRGQR